MLRTARMMPTWRRDENAKMGMHINKIVHLMAIDLLDKGGYCMAANKRRKNEAKAPKKLLFYSLSFAVHSNSVAWASMNVCKMSQQKVFRDGRLSAIFRGICIVFFFLFFELILYFAILPLNAPRRCSISISSQFK